MSKEMKERVSCEDLQALMRRRSGRVAVAIILHGEVDSGDGKIQLCTYGETAEDKVESHNLKEWIVSCLDDECYTTGGREVHESFILDAAKVKQERDEFRDLLKECERWIGSYRLGTGDNLQERLNKAINKKID